VGMCGGMGKGGVVEVAVIAAVVIVVVLITIVTATSANSGCGELLPHPSYQGVLHIHAVLPARRNGAQ